LVLLPGEQNPISVPGKLHRHESRSTRKGETVEVRRLAPEDACSTDMLVQIRWHGRTIAVPLSQLAGVKVDESTAEAVGDWHYWVAQGYCF